MQSELSSRMRRKLLLSNLLAQFSLDKRVPLKISRKDDYFLVSLPGKDIAVPSARRWVNYKRGWDRRLSRLTYQFGVGDLLKIVPGDTVIDIGANIGEFTCAVADMGATVHAVEGDPIVFPCLEFNTKNSGNIFRHQNVVWNKETTLTFYSEPSDANSSIFRPKASSDVTELKIAAVRLDTIAEKFGIGNVSFLKCDVEGAEPEVIEGAASVLMRTRAVAFDTGPERFGEKTSDACEALLRKLGFKVFHQRRLGRTMTFGQR